MARKVSKRAHIEALIEAMAPQIRSGFLAAFEDVVNGAQVAFIEKALIAGDLQAAIDAVQMSPASFNRYIRMIEQSYVASGELVAAQMPAIRDPLTGMRLIVRFDGRNLPAETWLKDLSSLKVTNLINNELQDIRDQLTKGMMRGDNPRTMALDLVGRIDPKTGRRSGGFIGLSRPQKEWLDNAAQELRSANPEGLQNYLTRTLRDKRYDKYVRQALRSGKPIDAKIANVMLGRYSDTLLRSRGEMIARTEALSAFGEAQQEVYRQLFKSGGLKKSQVVRVWRTAQDSRVRDSHGSMDGQRRGIDEPFISGDGNKLMYPQDPNAPASETIHCRCITLDEIDYFDGVD
jgi:hypothetical protein